MNLKERQAKLLRRQQQLTAAIQENEAQLLTRQRGLDRRAKIILGGALLSMPPGEREALLPMLTPHLSEREQRFVSQHLAVDQSPKATMNDGPN